MVFNFAGDDVLLGIDEICKKLSISRSTFERMRRNEVPNLAEKARSYVVQGSQGSELDGLPPFPPATITLGRSPRWSVTALNAWIQLVEKKSR